MPSTINVDFSPLAPNPNQVRDNWNAFDSAQQRQEQSNFGKLVGTGDLPGALKYATATGNVQGANLINNQQEQQFKLSEKAAELYHRGAAALKSIDPSLRDSFYKSNIVPLARQLGVKADVVPDSMADYSDGVLDSIANMGLSAADQYKIQRDQIEDRRKDSELVSYNRTDGSQGFRGKYLKDGETIDSDGNVVPPGGLVSTSGVIPTGDLPTTAPTGLRNDFISVLESGNRAGAKNPGSSASGMHQFTSATWLGTVKQANPAWARGLSQQQILQARFDPAKSTEMEAVLRGANTTALQNAGAPITDENLYAMHHFGNNGIRFANASDSAPITSILSSKQIAANPYLRGKTKGEVVANWNDRYNRFTGSSSTQVSVPGQRDNRGLDTTDRDGNPVYRTENGRLMYTYTDKDGITHRAAMKPEQADSILATQKREARLDKREDVRDAREAKRSARTDRNEAKKIQNDTFREERELRGQYQGLAEVKNFGVQRSSMQSILAGVKNPTAMSDIALIFNYMRVLDPNSTVREGEFATAQNAASVPDQVRNYVNKYINGQRLNPRQRLQMADAAARSYIPARDAYNRRTTEYRNLASDYGYNPNHIGQVATPTKKASESKPLSNGAGKTFANPVTITSRAQYNSLPSGTFIVAPNGKRVRKP